MKLGTNLIVLELAVLILPLIYSRYQQSQRHYKSTSLANSAMCNKVSFDCQRGLVSCNKLASTCEPVACPYLFKDKILLAARNDRQAIF
jgi:hypothetical protein